MPFWKVKAVRDEFFYGHACAAMDPAIYDERDFTYCKNAPSMFFQTPLITFLVRQHVDTVIVTGCTTSGCVRATIVDAFSYGFRVQVPEDCCGDAGEEPHVGALRDCGRRYCDVTSRAAVEERLRSLGAGARSGEPA
jgi:maleamate amidohydrolase